MVLSDYVPGARTPEEALTIIRGQDPDAYLVPPDPNPKVNWERIIRTNGHSLRMVPNTFYCQVFYAITR